MILTVKQEFARIGKARALGLRALGRLRSCFFADRIQERSFTMAISSWLSWPNSRSHARRGKRPNLAAPLRKARLFLEQLESRVTPSSGISTLGIFTGANGEYPRAGMIMDSGGNLYGTTDQGGASGDGTIFEVAKATSTITTLASFNGANGASPEGTLIMDTSGNLYGTTGGGGASGMNDGTVFELVKGSGTITTLASFNGANGVSPSAGLIMDSNGNLYGTTVEGGAYGTPYGDGTVFEVVKGSSTITTLASFNGSNGSDPHAGLVMDSGGNLYGTTYEGGADNDGSVFEVAKGSGTITTMASFNGTDGANPVAALIMDSSGNLYGTTYRAEATVFELAKGSGTITTLASFNIRTGGDPEAGLIMDSGGNLYGTTEQGGPSSNGYGTVFELAKGSGTITTLASFNGANGGSPESALIMDTSGNLYGTTASGGTNNEGEGTVFELLAHTPELNWNYPAPIFYGKALSSTQLDATATDSVTKDPVAGTFVYTPAAGTILPGGNHTLSVTFTPTDTTEYSPITTITNLVVNPAPPVLTWNTPASIAYGTPLSSTQLDATAADPTTGSPVSGTFAYTPGTGTILIRGSTLLNVTFTPTNTTDYYTGEASVTLAVTPSDSISTLASFSGANGGSSLAGLIMDSSGNLYGTTFSGGASNYGTVFEVAKGSGNVTTLATFNGSNGIQPAGELLLDGSGNLYGTTEGGNDNDGTVFELVKGSGTITTLASFNFTNGADPIAGLIMDSSGNLYGTTSEGGAYGTPYGDGTVFELVKGSSTITTLASFNASNASGAQLGPGCDLIADSSGNLYGTTAEGGTADYGTVFEVVKGSGTITTLASFSGGNGDDPQAGLIMDGSGNLYGTANVGGAENNGTVFEVVKGSGTITTLASFYNSNGRCPAAALIMDSSGNLYGTTEVGGTSNDGTVFEMVAGSGLITTLASFSGSGGEDPYDRLMMDGSGNLYGTTADGGASGDGTVFELPGAATPSASATASFLKSDTTTQGSWAGTYGAQGYDIVSGPTSLPSGDTVTPSGQLTHTYTTTSSDPRALQVPGSSNRVAAVWYSATNFTVDVNLADGQTHNLELYFDDWDNRARAEQVQISDAGTGKVLDTETISSFSNGLYLDWKVSGNLLITITNQGPANAVLNGVFLDSTAPPPPPTSTASFLKQDATTQGSWAGTYGAQGYDIVSGPTSLPSGDTVTPSGQLTHTYTTTSSDPRALQVPGSSNRVAAVWYSATNFTVDVNLADGQTHNLELYFDDWDNRARAEQVQISDAGTGKVLDTETISSFSNGLYLDWKVSGNLLITITNQGPANAVLNGVFLDPPASASTASVIKLDTTTQGNLIGVYGSQGYDIVSGPSSSRSYATVTPSGEPVWTYTRNLDDTRPQTLQFIRNTGTDTTIGTFQDLLDGGKVRVGRMTFRTTTPEEPPTT